VSSYDRAVDRLSRLVHGPSRLASPLLVLLSSGPPRLHLPVVTQVLTVPVRRSVRRIMCAPLFLMSYFRTGPPRHSSTSCKTPSSLRFFSYPPCSSWAYVLRATCAYATRAARRPFANPPGCGGAGAAMRRVVSVACGARRAAPAVAGLRGAAGASRGAWMFVG
jgi:hypothetical protein